MNSEFSFSGTSYLTKAEEPSLSYNLPIAGGRIIGFIPFPRVLVLCEMQLAWSRIWTRVAVSISYDDNHYTTGTYIHTSIYLSIFSFHTWSRVLWSLFLKLLLVKQHFHPKGHDLNIQRWTKYWKNLENSKLF